MLAFHQTVGYGRRKTWRGNRAVEPGTAVRSMAADHVRTEPRLHDSGNHGHDVNPLAANLVVERSRVGVQRVLRRAVHRGPRQAYPRANRFDVDYSPGTPLAHLRKHQAGKRNGSPKVDVEHTTGALEGTLRRGGEQSATGMVDQNVDPAE